ncbi:Ser/Thr protein phosphatase superfamily [Aspergillus alliaceus]|uniref:Ser/Thr protein phosphatase superfamily n=1 Tax=Petromyces alliaceus TaxID=209559 RepID=UPI0012A42E81|nr:uncharacterized protein BDW43DRAFT_286579 [Aspergillus alliaceus]KAB8230059.1 hypothetical protein BDW43DRAFT_286579 [Aspergillus alliaceus]
MDQTRYDVSSNVTVLGCTLYSRFAKNQENARQLWPELLFATYKIGQLRPTAPLMKLTVHGSATRSLIFLSRNPIAR